VFDIEGIATDLRPRKKISVTAISQDGSKKNFTAICRIDTPIEIEYYKHGGILHYVLRSLLRQLSGLEPQMLPKFGDATQKYRIIFRGEIEPGQELQKVKEHLAQLFKTTVIQVENFFSGKPVTLKTNLTHSAASEYVAEFKKMGILSYFEPIQAITTPQASAPPRNLQHPVAGKPSVAAPSHPSYVKSTVKTAHVKSKDQSIHVGTARGILTVFLLVILYLLYPALILFLANTLLDHIVDNTIFLSEYPLITGILAYFVPTFFGIMLLISMIKPFIARSLVKEFSVPISRKKEQTLISFIEKICVSLGFRLKINFEVDCSANVRLRYKKGFIGFLENNLTFTIGLPVISEMTLAEFGSVISSKLGHFSKRSQMYIYFIVTGINAWFTRVVYDEDQTDRKMTILSQTSGGFMSYLAVPITKFFIWLARKILALFMLIGEFLCNSYIRRMEFDADRSSVRLTGYETFESSLGKLNLLGEASKRAFLQLKKQRQPTDSSLPNNFIKLISSVIQKMSSEEIMKIKVIANKETTGTRDKKLTFRERLENARTITTKPAGQSDQPATTLLLNIDELALNATIGLYREVLGLQFEQSSLIPTSEFITSMEMYETTKPSESTVKPIDTTDLGDIIGSSETDSNPFT
jgi:Zn-dependent protease with chaperone function